MEEFGRAAETTGFGVMDIQTANQRAQELGDLDVALMKTWDDYAAEREARPDNPDLDGSEWKKRADKAMQEHVAGLRAGRTAGRESYAKWRQRTTAQASRIAFDQNIRNTTASIAANVESSTLVPDRSLDVGDPDRTELGERRMAIVSQLDRGRAIGINNLHQPEVFQETVRKALAALDENYALNLMKHDPSSVESFIDDPENFLEPGDKKRLHGIFRAQQTAARIEQERLAADQQEQNNQGLQAKIHEWQAGQGKRPDVGEIVFLEKNGLISPALGKWAMDELLGKKDLDPAQHGRAYQFLEEAIEGLQSQPPTLTREDWYKTRLEFSPYLTNQELAVFDSRANAKPGSDPEHPLRSEARKLAIETMDYRWGKPPSEPTGKEQDVPFTLQRDNAVTAVMQELEDWSRTRREQDKPVTDKEYRTKTREVIEKVYRDSFPKPQTQTEKGPSVVKRAATAVGKELWQTHSYPVQRALESSAAREKVEAEKPVQVFSEPENQAEFERMVATIKDDAEAEAYYHRFKDRF